MSEAIPDGWEIFDEGSGLDPRTKRYVVTLTRNEQHELVQATGDTHDEAFAGACAAARRRAGPGTTMGLTVTLSTRDVDLLETLLLDRLEKNGAPSTQQACRDLLTKLKRRSVGD